MPSSNALMPRWGRPEWNKCPTALRCHMMAPAVPMHGSESAQSTHRTGPFFKWSRRPADMRPSTPTPGLADASSLAMNTAFTDTSRSGFVSARRLNMHASMATWPKQSVVPRPYSLSPSTTSSNGFRSQVSGVAGTTSKWLPTNDTQRSDLPLPGYVMRTLPRLGSNSTSSTVSGPPDSFCTAYTHAHAHTHTANKARRKRVKNCAAA